MKRRILVNKNEKGIMRRKKVRSSLPDGILEHGAKVDQRDVAVQVLTYWAVGGPTSGNRAM